MAQVPAGGFELPDYSWLAPGELFPNGIDSQGAGDLGAGMVTWLYGIIGEYLLEFWAVLVPFFLAMFVFWLVLPRLGLEVDKLSYDVASKRDSLNGVAARRDDIRASR